ncbi:hypothetical protein BH23VER1_BH23VER1_08520 [soil metagenome]
MRRGIGTVGVAAVLIAVLVLVRKSCSPDGEGLDARRLAYDPAFDLPGALEVAAIPRASRFTYPLGSEHGALAYNAQPFLANRHLGEDWNGIGGENSDLGDAVYAVANGAVLYAGDAGGGWGKVVILGHRLEDGSLLQSFYGHLESVNVAVGSVVGRGAKVGTVGNVDGRYFAHLHFEIRDSPVVAPGQGYADFPLDRLAPSEVLDAGWGEGVEPWQLNESPGRLSEPPAGSEGMEMRFVDDPAAERSK